jgi:hypothetical protein
MFFFIVNLNGARCQAGWCSGQFFANFGMDLAQDGEKLSKQTQLF